jgi:hypothetical protein
MSATNIATFKLTRYSATVAKALQISVAKAQPDEPRDTLRRQGSAETVCATDCADIRSTDGRHRSN